MKTSTHSLAIDNSFSPDYLALTPTIVKNVLDPPALQLLLEEASCYSGDPVAATQLTRIFSPFLFLKHPNILSSVSDRLAGILSEDYLPAFDIFFVVHPGDPGANWHTGVESVKFLTGKKEMITLWISLVDLNDETGGRLPIFTSVAESYGISRLRRYLGYSLSRHGRLKRLLALAAYRYVFRDLYDDYCKANSRVFDHQAGDALLFADTCIHRSEPTLGTHTRYAYAIRFFRRDARFDLDVIRRLRDSTHHYVYDVLLNNNITSLLELRSFLSTNGERVFSEHPGLENAA